MLAADRNVCQLSKRDCSRATHPVAHTDTWKVQGIGLFARGSATSWLPRGKRRVVLHGRYQGTLTAPSRIAMEEQDAIPYIQRVLNLPQNDLPPDDAVDRQGLFFVFNTQLTCCDPSYILRSIFLKQRFSSPGSTRPTLYTIPSLRENDFQASF